MAVMAQGYEDVRGLGRVWLVVAYDPETRATWQFVPQRKVCRVAPPPEAHELTPYGAWMRYGAPATITA